MLHGSIFVNNKTQAVRLPVNARFDDSVKRVIFVKWVKSEFFALLKIRGIASF